MTGLEEYEEQIAKSIFGMTKTEAHEKGVCIDCKKPALAICYSEAGAEEYRLSGMCELCFDKMYDTKHTYAPVTYQIKKI